MNNVDGITIKPPPGHTPVTLTIPTPLYREWVTAARDAGHTIDTYLIDTVTIATRLKLIEGTQRLPARGAAIDPLLAEAIRVNSRGTTWEHKADLLLATPALKPEHPLPNPKDNAAVRSLHTDVAQQLMARHHFPVQQPAKSAYYMIIGNTPTTWNQTAALLAIWEHAGAEWTDRRLKDHASTAGLPARTIEPAFRQLITRGLIETRPNPRYIPHRSGNRAAKNQHRVHPDTAHALSTGNHRPN